MTLVQAPLLLSDIFVNRFIADPVGGNLYVPLAATNAAEGSWTISAAPLNDDNLQPFMGGMARVLGETGALYGLGPFRFARLPGTGPEGKGSECAVECSPLQSRADRTHVGLRYQFRHEPSMAVGSFSVLSKHEEAFQVAASYESRISTGTFVRMEHGILRRPDRSLALGRTLYTLFFSNPFGEADHIYELRSLLAIDELVSDLELGRHILESCNADISGDPSPETDGIWNFIRFKGAYDGGEMSVTIAQLPPGQPLSMKQVVLEVTPRPLVAPLPTVVQPLWNLGKQFTQSDNVAVQISSLLLAGQPGATGGNIPGNDDDN